MSWKANVEICVGISIILNLHMIITYFSYVSTLSGFDSTNLYIACVQWKLDILGEREVGIC